MVTVDRAPSGRRLVVGLVGCVKSKLSRPAPAQELYTSALFEGRRRWVEQTCDRWFILSALHGLVSPDEVLEPYDQALSSASSRARLAWSDQVLHQLRDTLGQDMQGLYFEIHAGSPYRDHGLIAGLTAGGSTVTVPAAGLSLGQQLAFYATNPRPLSIPGPCGSSTHRDPAGPKHRAQPDASVSEARGKYAPLADRLAMATSPLTMSFSDVEEILGGPLPASARKHRPWWANDASHTQAGSWLSGGWQVTAVDISARRATYAKVRP